MADDVKKIVFVTDTHYGHEIAGGKKRELHDPKAIDAVMQFCSDFKPDIFVHGGDALDMGAISHWNKSKRKSSEGLRVLEDIHKAKGGLIDPLNSVLPDAQKIFITGNHERFAEDLMEEYPGLEGLIGVDETLRLTETGWKVLPLGAMAKIGKLHFMHGDTLPSSNFAKAAVERYEKSVRFGHFHTFQAYTKISALDIKDARTGIAVPCLCKTAPAYGRSAPNAWLNGFMVAYLFPDGSYNDTVVVITDSKFHWNGTTYRG